MRAGANYFLRCKPLVVKAKFSQVEGVAGTREAVKVQNIVPTAQLQLQTTGFALGVERATMAKHQ